MRRLHHTIATLLALAVLTAPASGAQAQTAATASGSSANPGVVEIVAEDYALDAPDEIPSGWTTLRFVNEGEEPHMVFMGRLPEGTTFEDYETEAQVPFSRVWHAVRDDGADLDTALGMLGEVLPEWFPELEFVGGPGLLAPGLASEVTLELESGTYVLECYVKTEDGMIHYMEGMARPLTVTADRAPATPPDAHIRITLSNFEMHVEGELSEGRKVVAVHVAENPEQGFGHSVHLARLEPGAEAEDVVRWMNWFDVAGLRTPAPARFLGGMHPLPAGGRAYFTVDLQPGRYLWVSEATGAQGVLEEFTVE